MKTFENITFAVVSVTRNDSYALRRSRDSLNSQTYQKWIHVIVDGNSSVEHIRSISSFAQSKTIFLSEPDEGIYDAMNKGWKLVPSNFYIIFLNSGDEFAHPNSLESIANVICENDFPNFL